MTNINIQQFTGAEATKAKEVREIKESQKQSVGNIVSINAAVTAVKLKQRYFGQTSKNFLLLLPHFSTFPTASSGRILSALRFLK